MKMKGIITATVCGLLLALGGGTACLNSYAEDNKTTLESQNDVVALSDEELDENDMILKTWLPETDCWYGTRYPVNDIKWLKSMKAYYSNGEIYFTDESKCDDMGNIVESKRGELIEKTEYDEAGRKNKKIIWKINEDGTPSEIYDVNAFEYDENGDMVKCRYFKADGKEYAYEDYLYEYDEKGYLIKIDVISGDVKHTYKYDYDELGRKIKETWYSYLDNGEMVSPYYTYDKDGNIIQNIFYYKYDYDSYGNLIKKTEYVDDEVVWYVLFEYYDQAYISGEKFSTYEGNSFYKEDNGDVRCYDKSGAPVIDKFACDGTYTYYFQADGTAMKDRLTYHPDGEHVIYFDSEGHEVFSDFANVKKTIAGDEVNDFCFFDVFGYMYVDVVTYDKTGTVLYYANAYGVMEMGKWFQFSDNVTWADGREGDEFKGGYGCANSDGTLITNTQTVDWEGRNCYLQGNGVALY